MGAFAYMLWLAGTVVLWEHLPPHWATGAVTVLIIWGYLLLLYRSPATIWSILNFFHRQ